MAAYVMYEELFLNGLGIEALTEIVDVVAVVV